MTTTPKELDLTGLEDLQKPKVVVHQCTTCMHDPKKCKVKPCQDEGHVVSTCVFREIKAKQPEPPASTITMITDGQNQTAKLNEVQAMSRRIRSQDPDDRPNRNDVLRESHHIAKKLMKWGDLPSTPIPMSPEKIAKRTAEAAKALAKEESPDYQRSTTKTVKVEGSVELPDFTL